MSAKIQLKRGTAADLYAVNPILLRGEPALEVDTNKIKYGDGTTAWRDLPYGNASIDVIDGGELYRPGVSPNPDAFIPPNLSGLALWLDVTDPDYFSVVNNRVAELSDKSLYGRHFFQSLKAHRPVADNQINDLDVLTFDGTNDAMLSTFDLPAQCTVFIVVKRRGTSPNDFVFSGVKADNSTVALCGLGDTGNSIGVVTSTLLAAQSVDDLTPAVYSVVFDVQSVTTRINGLSAQTADYANTSPFKKFALGSSRTDYAGNSFGGDVAEVVIYNRILPESERQQVDEYLLGRWGIVQTVHPLLTGMVAFWPMNEENGNRLDVSGNNKTFVVGTGSASQVVGSAAGVLGLAADFTGDNYLEADIVPPVQSFSCWFKIAAADAQKPYHQIIGQWKSGGVWVLDHTPNGLQFTCNESGSGNGKHIPPNGTNLADDMWHHVVGTYDDGTYKLYVDNALYGSVATPALTYESTNRKLRVGICDYDDSNDYRMVGTIDSVGVWSRTLTADDVAMLWNGGFGKEEFIADTFGDNVSLLLHMNKLPNAAAGGIPAALFLEFNGANGSTDFVDSSAANVAVSAYGGAQISTTKSITGGSSLSLPSYSAWAAISSAAALDLSSGDFTIEFWAYTPSQATSYPSILGTSQWMVNDAISLRFSDTRTPNCFSVHSYANYVNNSEEQYLISGPVATNAWHHVAFTREGTTDRLFVDGVLADSYEHGTQPNWPNLTANGEVKVGNSWDGYGGQFVGYVDNLKIVQGTAVYTEDFTPPDAPPPDVPPDYATALLMNGEGPGFTDSSGNNIGFSTINSPAIIPSGKFGSCMAMSYGGLVSDTDAIPDLASQAEWTIECWYYIPAAEIGNYVSVLYLAGLYGAGFNMHLYYNDTLHVNNAQSPALIGNFPAGTYGDKWTHIAVVRKNSTTTLYLDGVAAATTSQPPSPGPYTLNIAGTPNGSNASTAQFDDIRILPGKALYTENFTPPTAPLSPVKKVYDRAATALLLHFDGANGSTTFTDASANALTVTANGSSAISTSQSQFGGASGYFDGSSSVSVPYSAKFSPAGSALTIEFWLNPDTSPANPPSGQNAGGGLVSLRNGPVYCGYELAITGGRYLRFLGYNGSGWAGGQIFGTTQLTANQWHHVALVIDATGATRVYVDGISDSGFASLSVAYAENGSDATVYIGEGGDGHYVGYMDELRITKGAALYTSNFTPPATALSDIQPLQPALLLHFNGDFTDSSNNNLTVTPNGNAVISTTQSKFGGASGYFDGTAELVVSSSPTLSFGVGDFTVEAWVYLNSLANDDFIASPVNSGGWFFGFHNGVNGGIGFGRKMVAWDLEANTGVSLNTWFHVAASRSNGVLRLFLDGVKVQEAANTIDYSTAGGDFVVGSHSQDYYLNGYLDEFRIVKGKALYTADFTPPTKEFPYPPPLPPAPTTGLSAGLTAFWKMDDLTDFSGNNYTLTNYGYVTFEPGKIGNAAYFNGSPQSLILSGLRVATSAGYTLSCWAKYSDTINLTPLFFQAEPFTWCGTPLVALGPTGAIVGSQACSEPNANTDTDVSNNPLPDTDWHMYTAAYDGQTLKFYVDGQLFAQDTFDGAANGIDTWTIRDLYIGSGVNEYYSEKWIDGFGIWSRALTEAEITSLYNNGNGTETLTGGGTAGPVTYFYDHSIHHHALTANGDAQIKTNEVRFGNAAGVFDGDGDYLTAPYSAEWDFGTGDFTIECWVYPEAGFTSGDRGIVSAGGFPNGWALYLAGEGGSSGLGFAANQGSGWSGVALQTTPVTAGAWHHVALVRVAGVLKAFADGVQVGTSNNFAGNLSAAGQMLQIGTDRASHDYGFFKGVIDDLRITKGVARYTANFNVPVKEFPDPIIATPANPTDPYAEDVVLLLHCDGADGSTVFTDNSYLQNTVTANGNAVISTAQSKFGGASGYFDGSTGYLAVADTDALNLGVGGVPFTAEMWLYPEPAAASRVFFSRNGGDTASWNTPNSLQIEWWLDASNAMRFVFKTQSGFAELLADATVEPNQWTHVAATYDGTTTKIFINGVKQNAESTASYAASTGNITHTIGMEGGAYYFPGYIDDFRVTLGVARYTANFAPPTAAFPNPFTPAAQASLLLHFDSVTTNAFTDSSANALTVTPLGVPVITAAQSQFGGAACDFDGSSRVVVEHPDLFNFGDGDFTVELWARLAVSRAYEGGFITTATNSSGTGADADGIWFGFQGSGLYWGVGSMSLYGNWYFLRSVNGGAIDANLGSLADEQWYHLAMVRDGDTFKLFKDGVLVDSITAAVTLTNANNTISIGGRLEYSQFFTGQIDEVRVVKGTALYTTDFTPPAAPFSPGGFQPVDVIGNDLWLDSDSPLVLGTNDVLSWGDLSGSNHPATNADYSPPPIVAEAATPSGLRAIHFDGNPNVLAVTHQFNLKNSSGFVVVRQTSQTNGPGYPRVLSLPPTLGQDAGSNDGATLVINQYSGQAVEFFSNNANCSVNVTLPLAWSLLSYTIDDTGTVRLRKDGVEVASFQNSSMTATAGPEMLLGFGGTFQSYESLQGDIAAVVVYDHKLGDAALTAVERYLQAKYLTVQTTPYYSPALLMHFNGPNNGTTFTDSSLNNHAITRNNDVITTTVTSRFGGASAYFGQHNWLSIPSNDSFNFDTGPFTIEMWVNTSSFTTNDPEGTVSCYIGKSGDEGGPDVIGLWLFETSPTAVNFYCGDGPNSVMGVGGNHNMTTGTWYHIAVSRDAASDMRMFVNGTQVGTTVNVPGNFSNNYEVTIGGRLLTNRGGDGRFRSFDGYIDELRVVKGAAVYTANFTPPTQPFGPPPAALLLNFDGPDGSTTFTDKSPLSHTITRVGNPVVATAQSKFGGASLYLDGSSWLVAENASDIAYGNGDFTLESWVYLTAYPSGAGLLFGHRNDTNDYKGVSWYVDTSGNIRMSGTANASGDNWQFPATDFQFGVQATLNQWQHIALVRSGNTVTLYLDGVAAPYTTTLSDGIANGSRLAIGSGWTDSPSSQTLTGYFDDVRITLGVALYKANFTPPTLPLGSEVALSLHFEGTNGSTLFLDSSPNSSPVTANGAAVISTAQSKFGGSSAFFSNQGYLDCGTLFDFTAEDWTIEFWLFADNSQLDKHIVSNIGPNNDFGLNIYLTNTGELAYNNGQTITTCTGSYAAHWNTWTHIAVVRKNGTISLYINGTLAGQPTTQTPGPNQWLFIGKSLYSGYEFTGYVDDFRVTKNAAIYTDNFTPPTASFNP